MSEYAERYYLSHDGLRLFFRDYPGPAGPTPVLCIPGLTRNSRDFDFIARHIAATRRVLCADLRGRGKSAYDPNWQNYTVPIETADMFRLLEAADAPRVVVLGTSRGGVIAMTIAMAKPEALAGAVLNDMGAQLEPDGLERIYQAMEAPPSFGAWDEAVQALKRAHNPRLANIAEGRWLEFAHALYRENEGRIVGDYDPNFPLSVLELRGSNPRTDAGAVNLWKPFAALGTIPTLVLRGENSDLLSAEMVTKMQAAKPDLAAVTVKDRGHVPFLDEPEALAAIDAFLRRVA
jgi:pimeloyl-ACP methyl ester carboxylesterase